MGSIRDIATSVFRDFVVDRLPASGHNDPAKFDIRAVFGIVDTAVGAATAGLKSYATKASLDADNAQADGTLAYVYGDATSANNGVYQSVGGAWSASEWYFNGLSQAASPLLDELRFNVSDNLLSDAYVSTQLFNGAANILANGVLRGVSVPSGQTGQSSVLQAAIPIDGASLAGSTIRLTFGADTTATFSRAAYFYLQVNTTAGDVSREYTLRQFITAAGRYVAVIDYLVHAEDRYLKPFSQFNSASPTSSEETIQLTDLTYGVIQSANDALGPMDQTLKIFRQQLLSSVATPPSNIVTVKPSGGDYADLASAMAAITDASAGNPYVIRIWPNTGDGSWPIIELAPKDHVSIEGIGTDRVWLKGYQADDSAPGLAGPIAQNSTLRWSGNGSLKNLKITCQNMRYPIHADSAAMTNATQLIDNCWIEHLGNEEARQYQIGLGHDPDTYGGTYFIWSSLNAWGCGTWPGYTLTARDSTFQAPSNPVLLHNTDSDTPQPTPAMVEFDACYVNALSGAGVGWAFNLQSFGTGQTDVCRIVNSKLVGDINMSTQARSQENWLVTGGGNAGVNFSGASVREQLAT